MIKEEVNPIYRILENDNTNVGRTIGFLRARGILALVERVPELYLSMFEQIGKRMRDGSVWPVDTDERGEPTSMQKSWVFRIVLAQSAQLQYIQAVNHLLRGHISEMYANIRTMIENAGVANRSLNEKRILELAESFSKDKKSRRDYIKLTSKGKLFPSDEELDRALSAAFDLSSYFFHSNLRPMMTRIRSSFELTADMWDYRLTITPYDEAIPPMTHEEFVLKSAAQLLTIAGGVLSLWADTFKIKDSEWYKELKKYTDEQLIPKLKKEIPDSEQPA